MQDMTHIVVIVFLFDSSGLEADMIVASLRTCLLAFHFEVLRVVMPPSCQLLGQGIFKCLCCGSADEGVGTLALWHQSKKQNQNAAQKKVIKVECVLS